MLKRCSAPDMMKYSVKLEKTDEGYAMVQSKRPIKQVNDDKRLHPPMSSMAR